MGEDLPLLLAGKIGAGRGRGQVELRRVARVLGHGAMPVAARSATGSRMSRLAPRLPRSRASKAESAIAGRARPQRRQRAPCC